jgi:RimJ/RimL family protein N-acetyltransferase
MALGDRMARSSGLPRPVRLVPSAWRQGVATEAVAAMLAYFRDHDVGPLVALIHPDNAASHAVARKVGLRLDGETVAWNARQMIYRLG